MEDLRYLADAQLSAFTTPLARAQIAAALALARRSWPRGKKFSRRPAKVSLRRRTAIASRAPISARACATAPGVLTLAVEGGADSAQIDQAAQVVESARDAIDYASTQEESWMVLAAEALAARDAIDLARHRWHDA